MRPTRYADRAAAGEVLAGAVADRLRASGLPGDDVLVLGLPRGGVPVAAPVAAALGAPLDVLVVRKVGRPGHEELAMGAVATGSEPVRNDSVIRAARVSDEVFAAAVARERSELQRRSRAYRDDRPWPRLTERVVVLVDDGLATGSTMRAAVLAVRQQLPRAVVVAVPVAAEPAVHALAAVAEEVVCPLVPPRFAAVGAHYDDFDQTTDEEVRRALDLA